MYNGVLSTQNAYACAKQMKSKRQTDEYYSLHLYIYSRQQHSKNHRVNANVYDSQHQTHTNTHTSARFVHSVMLFPLRLGWQCSWFDFIQFDIFSKHSFDLFIFTTFSYGLLPIFMIIHSRVFFRYRNLCWIIFKFVHIQSAFFQFFTFDWSKHNSTNLFWLKIEKVVCFFLN